MSRWSVPEATGDVYVRGPYNTENPRADLTIKEGDQARAHWLIVGFTSCLVVVYKC